MLRFVDGWGEVEDLVDRANRAHENHLQTQIIQSRSCVGIDDNSKLGVCRICDKKIETGRLELFPKAPWCGRCRENYGICIDCHDPIPMNRMQGMPCSIRCTNCQEKADKHPSPPRYRRRYA